MAVINKHYTKHSFSLDVCNSYNEAMIELGWDTEDFQKASRNAAGNLGELQNVKTAHSPGDRINYKWNLHVFTEEGLLDFINTFFDVLDLKHCDKEEVEAILRKTFNRLPQEEKN